MPYVVGLMSHWCCIFPVILLLIDLTSGIRDSESKGRKEICKEEKIDEK